MTMTKQQWEMVQKSLHLVSGWAKLQCDNYKVDLHKVQVTDSRLTIAIYVDGWRKGAWLLEDCEERRRFYQKKKGFLFPKKVRDACIKRFGKKAAERDGVMKAFDSYRWEWGDFKKLKAHLIANNTEITLIDCSEMRRAAIEQEARKMLEY